MSEGCVIWLTGISGAGKTTLGRSLVETFEERGIRCEFLDGDDVRDFFEGDLGYTPAERVHNVRRIAFAAKLLADHGIVVVVANIAPYYEVRNFIRSRTPRYFQVYVRASRATARERDVKGHYAKFDASELNNLIGCDDAYDEPRAPDAVADTDNETVDQSLAVILRALTERGFLK